jgi:hypothetical protein
MGFSALAAENDSHGGVQEVSFRELCSFLIFMDDFLMFLFRRRKKFLHSVSGRFGGRERRAKEETRRNNKLQSS